MAVASIIFYTPDGRILLQERKGISRFDEEWAFFGGGIEEGESPEQAIIREVHEELNYDLKGHHYLTHQTVVSNGPRKGVIVHYFIARVHDLSRFTLKEGSAMKLFTIAEARKLNLIPGGLEALDMIEKVL